MEKLKTIYARAAKRHGGEKGLAEQLARPRSAAAIRRVKDDRILADMTRGVFSAGFVWRVIEAKWDGFEEAFHGFDPVRCSKLSEKALEKLARDERIVRNPQKIRAVRENARFCVELAEEHGSAARYFAAWPASDIVGLWDELKRRGSRLGGFTGQWFLRHLGVDTPMLSSDVVQALRNAGAFDAASPTSKKAQRQIQEAFNAWADESGRSLTEISRILACSCDA